MNFKNILDELPEKYEVDLKRYILSEGRSHFYLDSSVRHFITTAIHNEVRTAITASDYYFFTYDEELPDRVISAIKKAKPIIKEDNDDII
ncbi:MAG: hypothetical protein ACP6IQ_01965 [Candidatus Njordarchaeia archaeon]